MAENDDTELERCGKCGATAQEARGYRSPCKSVPGCSPPAGCLIMLEYLRGSRQVRAIATKGRDAS
jgi:LSD1 subclass zinc finger protein